PYLPSVGRIISAILHELHPADSTAVPDSLTEGTGRANERTGRHKARGLVGPLFLFLFLLLNPFDLRGEDGSKIAKANGDSGPGTNTPAGRPVNEIGGAAFGPLYHEFHLTLAPGERTEALGPLFYRERKESVRVWAVPPLFSRTFDPELDFAEVDFVYPILT